MNSPVFKVNVSVVIKKTDTFLLIQRAKDEEVYPGLWGIPGGTVELADTTLEAALERECLEEVGITIKDIQLISNNIRSLEDKSGALYLVYSANYAEGTPEPLEGTDAVNWLSLERIRQLDLTPKTLEIIESCL